MVEQLKNLGPVDRDITNIGGIGVPDFGATSQLRPGVASIEICTLMHDNVSNQRSGKPSTSPEKMAIGQYVQSIQIYENMNVFGIRGYLDMADVDNLITGHNIGQKKFIPLIGEKLLFLKFRNALSKFYVNFENHPLMVHKITKVESQPVPTGGDQAHSQFAIVYRLHFMSPELFWNERVSISEVMEGTYSDMVKKILQQHIGTKKDIWLEETLGTHKIIASGKPFDVIRWLLPRCLKKDPAGMWAGANKRGDELSWKKRWMNVADFVFFETTKGFNFKSIGNSKLQTSISITPIPTTEGYINQMHTALDYKFTKMTDVYDGIRNGMWGASLAKHDMYYKTLQWHNMNYIEDWKGDKKSRWCSDTLSFHPDVNIRKKILAYAGTVLDTPEIDETGRISDYPSSVGYLIGSSNRRMFDHIEDGIITQPDQDNECELWKMQRGSQLAHADYMNMQVTVNGMSGLQTGEMVYMKIPQLGMAGLEAAQSGKVELDPLLADYWIIKGITHILNTTGTTDTGYKCRLDLMNARLSPADALPTYDQFTYAEKAGAVTQPDL